MKTNLAALFCFLSILSFSCKEEEKHKILRNDNGTIEFEIFRLDNGTDSSVGYSYYANGAKESVSSSISKRENMELYYYYCFYDSATGKLSSETYLDSSSKVLRERSSRFEYEWQKVVTRERFGRTPSGAEYQLAWTFDGEMPLDAEYYGPEGKSVIQNYDSLGKIESVFIYTPGVGKDTTMDYKTPEAKAAFRDTVLQMIFEMRKRVVFPGPKK